MIKTITLTGNEVEVSGLTGTHAHLRNDGTSTIYAAKTAGITPGADGVGSVQAGKAYTLRGISGTIFLLGTGSVHIQSDDIADSPFDSSAASGGSGETAETVSGCILSGAAVVGYVIGEGLPDGAHKEDNDDGSDNI